MFLDSTEIAGVHQLDRLLTLRWEEIREHARSRLPRFAPWHEPLHNGGWSTYALKWQRRVLDPVFPWLYRTDVRNAGYSLLAPGTEIEPHHGYTGEVLRYHLGLDCPDQCGIQVSDEVRAWQDGHSLLFDDTQMHSAWNRSDRPRLILLVDIERQ